MAQLFKFVHSSAFILPLEHFPFIAGKVKKKTPKSTVSLKKQNRPFPLL
ncbi:Hypothetical protein Minf_1977 [Methylacidiphilum infernorum V4]|uniref:Uncharacterized protein n=1 Tax=Methylacidiphilum infernorum (isolate V4) TaxID=481448 RepID=B3DYI3_METI4|nr:Hypothetical protein Minf_1977 [Methylacidiphilum infernorum V4]